MSFSESAGVITQTGTDTDLSGLSGLTGITTWTSDPDTDTWGQDFYVMDASTRLVIDGTLTIEPDYECLIVEGTATNTSDAPVRVNGTLNYGVAKSGNGQTIYSQGTGLNFTDKGTNNFGHWGLAVTNGGTMNWNGGIYRTASTVRFYSGCTLNVNKGTFFDASDLNCQFRLTPSNTGDNATLNINDLVLDGIGGGTARFFTTFGFNSAVFTLLRGQIQQYNGSYPIQVYSDFKNQLNVAPNDFVFTNSVSSRGNNIEFKGLDKRITYDLGSNRYGYVKTYKTVNLSPLDLDGSGISYSFYGVDIDNGNRTVGPNDGGVDGTGDLTTVDQDDTANKVYSGIDQTGDYSEDILIETFACINSVGTADDRTNSDKIPIRFIGYNQNITTWNSDLIGVGTLTEDVIMTPDLSIIEATKATVDAYSTLDTIFEAYDAIKSELFDNYAGETETIISRNETQLICGARGLTIDASAGSVRAYSASLVTLKSSAFIGGYDGSGTLNQLNGALITDLVLSGGATWNAVQSTWTGSAGATETIDVANTGTYDATGFTFDASTTLNNSSGGVVDIVINAGQQQPTVTGGGTTNFLNAGATVTFNNLTSANVQIIEDDNTTVNDRQISQTGTLVFNTPDGSSGTWCYIINREGYEPITGTYTADGIDVIVDATQDEKTLSDGSSMYTGTTSAFLTVTTQADGSRMNLRVADGAISAQVIFNEVEDALQTQDGMTYLCNGGGQVSIALLPTGQFVFLKTNVRVIRDTAPDANATIEAFVQSTDGIVLDNTNGSVQFVTPNNNVNIVSVNGTDVTDIDDFKADISGLATQSSVDTIDANVDAILADTNELQTNQGDWATATGFATTTNVTDSEANIIAEVNTNETKIDLIETKAQADTRQTALLAQHTQTQSDIAGLNNLSTADIDARLTSYGLPTLTELTSAFTEIKGAGWTTSDTLKAISDSVGSISGGTTPADVWAYATRTVTGGTIDTNNDMRGTDGANTVVPDNAGITANGVAISALNNLSEAQVKAQADQALTDADLATNAQAQSIKQNTDIIPALL